MKRQDNDRKQVDSSALVKKLDEIASTLEKDPLFQDAKVVELRGYIAKAKGGMNVQISRKAASRYINEEHGDHITELVAKEKISGYPLPHAEHVFAHDLVTIGADFDPPEYMVSWKGVTEHLLKSIG